MNGNICLSKKPNLLKNEIPCSFVTSDSYFILRKINNVQNI